MPLTSFGAVLTFAESLEKDDAAFYTALAGCQGLPAADAALYQKLAAECVKNAKMLARTKRENVTEMILEPIQGLTRDAFAAPACPPAQADKKTAAALETRAQGFYTTAAERLPGLPEVARVLKRMAKKRADRLALLG